MLGRLARSATPRANNIPFLFLMIYGLFFLVFGKANYVLYPESHG
jgi:hypothetical protein